MLDRIIRFALSNRLLILICAVLLMLGGIYTTLNTDVDVFPDLNAPTVVIMTEAEGMAPEEVEKLVTFPVETAVNGATDVRRVRSSSTTGFSVVWVEFDWGTDIYLARQIVSEKLAEVSESLPETVGKPTIGPQSSILGEMLIIGMTSETTSLEELRTIADWSIRPRLLSMGGVAQVTVIGGDIREYQILLQPDKMGYYGVGLDKVIEATENMNGNAAGGILYQYGNEYIVSGLLSTQDTDAMAKTVVARTDNGMPVTLGQIAEIRTGSKSPVLGKASVRAHDAVLLTVTKQPAASTIGLTSKLDDVVREIQQTLPADVKLHTDIFRQQKFIDSSIDNICKSLYEGGIFVVIVLFIFLMNGRTTLISLVTIPLALLVTIITLNLLGMTINTMSIGGMAIAIGSLVDDAIVDVENVYKRLRQNRLLPQQERRNVLQVVFQASREVRLPILNSTFIIVVSFVPLFFLSGMEGRMLKPLGIAFITSLFASTMVALTLTPVLCSLLLGRESGDRVQKEPIVVRYLQKYYERALGWVLDHTRMVLVPVLALLAVALMVFFSLGHSFLPEFNEGSFTINVSTMPGISLEESDRVGRRAEEILLTVPEIRTVARKTGRAELDEHALGVNTSEIEAPFELMGRPKSAVLEEIREKFKELPGVNAELGQPISHRIDAMLSGTRSNIAIKLFGTDLNRMYAIANEIKKEVGEIEGVVDLNVEQQIERPQLQIIPRREMMARYGITPKEFADMTQMLLSGKVLSQVYEGNNVFDLTVKIDPEIVSTIDDIRNMQVVVDDVRIPLGELAEVRSTAGPNTINRENVSRKLVVSANVAGGDLQGVVKQMKEKIEDEIELPEGYHVEFGGQFESAQTASRILTLASVISILVIFLLLYAQFHDVRQSAVVLLNLPLALIGGVFAIWMSDGIVSIPAIIGFISLFGIATRNGMLLIDRYNDLRASGMDMKQAVLAGSMDRLNPILMTALTSALALVPLALGGDLPGNEIQSPMAKVILGGLLTSTLLNGFIIPVMYMITGKAEKSHAEQQKLEF